eukprot:59798-Rhodomonas_salina.1
MVVQPALPLQPRKGPLTTVAPPSSLSPTEAAVSPSVGLSTREAAELAFVAAEDKRAAEIEMIAARSNEAFRRERRLSPAAWGEKFLGPQLRAKAAKEAAAAA